MESTTKERNMPRTTAEAMQDTTSSLHRKVTKAQQAMSENDKVIARLMATGLTREQAYMKALCG
jgi:NADH:ubiquinone oxidoreductase subunit D